MLKETEGFLRSERERERKLERERERKCHTNECHWRMNEPESHLCTTKRLKWMNKGYKVYWTISNSLKLAFFSSTFFVLSHLFLSNAGHRYFVPSFDLSIETSVWTGIGRHDHFITTRFFHFLFLLSVWLFSFCFVSSSNSSIYENSILVW